MTSMELDDGSSPSDVAFTARDVINKAYTTSKRDAGGASREALPPNQPPTPPKGPGGGSDDDGNSSAYDGGMEQRVAALEGFASDAKDKLTRIETKLEHIEKEVSNFKWWVVAQIAAGFIAVIGTGVAIQQMTVATFQAAGAQANPPQPAQPPIIINVPATQAAPATTQPPAPKK